MLIYLLFKAPHHWPRFRGFDFGLNIYWNATYGIWTMYNFVKMISAPQMCTSISFSLTKLSYHGLLILGIFPAVMILLGVFALVFCVPYFLWD